MTRTISSTDLRTSSGSVSGSGSSDSKGECGGLNWGVED